MLQYVEDNTLKQIVFQRKEAQAVQSSIASK